MSSKDPLYFLIFDQMLEFSMICLPDIEVDFRKKNLHHNQFLKT